MNQPKLPLVHMMIWQDAHFWERTSSCKRFSIKSQVIDGVKDFALWRHGETGAVIPKCLGIFQTFAEAAEFAERANAEE